MSWLAVLSSIVDIVVKVRKELRESRQSNNADNSPGFRSAIYKLKSLAKGANQKTLGPSAALIGVDLQLPDGEDNYGAEAEQTRLVRANADMHGLHLSPGTLRMYQGFKWRVENNSSEPISNLIIKCIGSNSNVVFVDECFDSLAPLSEKSGEVIFKAPSERAFAVIDFSDSEGIRWKKYYNGTIEHIGKNGKIVPPDAIPHPEVTQPQ
jgi:hypothetical protein